MRPWSLRRLNSVRIVGSAITGNLRVVAEFAVFCLLFSKAMLGWAEEIETSGRANQPASDDARANTANTAKLFRGGVPVNANIVDLVVRLFNAGNVAVR